MYYKVYSMSYVWKVTRSLFIMYSPTLTYYKVDRGIILSILVSINLNNWNPNHVFANYLGLSLMKNKGNHRFCFVGVQEMGTIMLFVIVHFLN